MSSPADAGSTTAVRSDPDLGISDTVEFLGSQGNKLFGCLHLPSAAPVEAVVLCCSIHSDFEHNYRREVLVSRSLAARRIAVARFHYRGQGNSDGGSADVTFDTMVEDALVATEWLGGRTGIMTPAFLGTRWGAMIAAAAAARTGGGPLVLWEPVVQASRYFREAIRARAARSVKSGVTARPSAFALEEELAGKGRVDVLGYPIERSLYESAAERTLARELGERPRRILLVQLDRRRALRTEYATLVEGWRDAGFPVQTATVSAEEAWWFKGDQWVPEERRPATAMLTQVTRDWLRTPPEGVGP